MKKASMGDERLEVFWRSDGYACAYRCQMGLQLIVSQCSINLAVEGSDNTFRRVTRCTGPEPGACLVVWHELAHGDKKVLVLEEAEASVVRLIYDMASGKTGRPMGVKAIAVHLNERGIRRRGRKFSTGKSTRR